MSIRRSGLPFVALLLWAVSVMAQTGEATSPKTTAESAAVATIKENTPVETIIIYPSQLPKPELKYRLYPKFIEQSPGNAASQYMKAAIGIPADARKLIGDEKFDVPLKQFPVREAKQLLQKCQPQLDLIRLAARRTTCDWELPLREGKWVNSLLPEVQEQRQLARLIHTQIRSQLAEGKLDEAIDSIKTLMAMGRHVAAGPTLINALVGVAISGMALDEVGELMQQPGCPNLFWALTALPSPFIDVRPALEMEGDGLYFFMPSLVDLRDAKLTEEGWNKRLMQAMKEYMHLGGGSSADAAEWKFALTGIAGVLFLEPQCRIELKSFGYTEEQLAPMPAAQIILLAMIESYEHTRDETFKWMFVPYYKGIEGFRSANNIVQKQGASPMPVLAALLTPALAAARAAVARNDRDIAATRIVAGLQLYAARHNGKLPEQLTEIDEVPIPEDPMTGKPFLYRLEDGRAMLESLIPENQQLRWQIKVAAMKD